LFAVRTTWLLLQFIDKLMDTTKSLKTSVSAVDGPSVG